MIKLGKKCLSGTLCLEYIKIFWSTSRYSSLIEPSRIRRDNLEDAQLMYQYYRDIEDELLWIEEKKPVAASTELGSSLVAVQYLMKKHQV